MPKNWKWKATIVLLAAILGVYLLIPTAFHFDKDWETFETKGQPVPWFVKLFPDKTLNLGLDLRGGIYIEMEVDIKSAVKRKVDLFATDIEMILKDENISFDSISQPAGNSCSFVWTLLPARLRDP